MDNSRPPPPSDTGKQEEGGNLVRQSSLLPGEVRTPTVVVSLSDAWDVSGDWAAPGSSVWEDDARSRHSNQTPLTGYGRDGDVWASATGSPLLGSDEAADGVNAFSTAAAAAVQVVTHQSPMPDAAELAAAALQAFVPHGGPVDDPHGQAPSSLLPQHHPHGHAEPYSQPRYAPEGHYNYENRFGTVHTTPVADTVRAITGVTSQRTSPQLSFQQKYQQQLQPQPSYFTVQEGDGGRGGRGDPFYSSAAAVAERSSNYGIPALSTDVIPGSGAGAGYFPGPGSTGGVPFVPRLDDEDVAHSIIASAGLPLSMHSLVDYIRGGQPQTLSHVSALGTTQNAVRNYPNLNEPPSEEGAFHGGSNGAGGRNGRLPHSPNVQQQPQGHWSQPTTETAENAGFAVRGGDYTGNTQHTPSPPPTFRNNSSNGDAQDGDSTTSGGFVVSAGNGPVNPRISPHSGFHCAVAGRHKSESEYLSDLLHFHANFFPPPPPPRVPKEERRNRAELWYHYASKWDITHRLPPPPRTPLPEMELEYRMRLQRMTRVPYHGDGWLQMSERWFDVTQMLFDFPDENVGEEVDFNVVVQQAVLS
jgi:hypothetical protein